MRCCLLRVVGAVFLSSCAVHQLNLLSVFFFSLPFVRFDPQVSLFESIKPLFANKQLLVIANKTDVAPFADIK